MNRFDSTSKMTQFFSEKLRVVSFISILIVLYLHAGFPEDVCTTMKIPVIVRCCIAGVFGPCAVPMFYAISGFLFFYGTANIRRVFEKMKKRIITLVVPFIIAALSFPLFFIMMEFIPGAAEHINSESYLNRFLTLPIQQILISLFYDSGNGKPWAYHLWFMRDLVVIIAFSPILYYARRWGGYWSIALVLILHYIFPHLSFLYSLFWFVAGSFILDKTDKLPKWSIYLMLIAFLSMACYRLICLDGQATKYTIIEISLGVVSLWSLYDCLIPSHFELSAHPILNNACQFTFFIYLYHEPAFHIIVKGIPLILGNNWVGYTISFLLSPILMVIIGTIVGYILKKAAPNLYSIIVGGR